ncbi:MAG: FumA C-terminus/TtdB family hydratase beta subunit [Oscillospiraceae bacterium]|jgi:fumarate hydratase subunit beta|nr:FumA C-terminus/TtdB family hydratase beta subunit [Oscillospiraceae bacterium]
MKTLLTPLTRGEIASLQEGTWVSLSGVVYTARDAAHKRLCELLDGGGLLPFPLEGSAIFYAGPCPTPSAKQGSPVIGPVGPTTSGRMDGYAPRLMREAFHVTIGKGPRSQEVAAAIRRYGCAYLSAIGGAAALTARCVEKVEPVAFEDLGTEAVVALTVRDLPLIVMNV